MITELLNHVLGLEYKLSNSPPSFLCTKLHQLPKTLRLEKCSSLFLQKSGKKHRHCDFGEVTLPSYDSISTLEKETKSNLPFLTYETGKISCINNIYYYAFMKFLYKAPDISTLHFHRWTCLYFQLKHQLNALLFSCHKTCKCIYSRNNFISESYVPLRTHWKHAEKQVRVFSCL